MVRIRAPLRALLGFAIFSGVSCDGIIAPKGRERVEVTPATVDLLIGDIAWLTATVYDDGGRAVPGAEISWRRAPENPWNVYNVELGTAAGNRNRLLGAVPGAVQVIAESGGRADTVVVSVRGYSVSFASVTAGMSGLTCGLTPDGEAYCWGTQYSGPHPAGGESIRNTYAPAPVSGGLRFVSLVVGAQFACGLTRNGVAYCWGLGESGVLGNGSTPYLPSARFGSTSPIPVAGGLLFTSLVAGSFHTCGLTREGVAHCWGSDFYGQLGDGPASHSCDGMPCSRVPVPVAGGFSFKSLSLGAGHSCGITTGGETYCWGINNYEQLGNATATEICKDLLSSHHCSRVPVPVVDGPAFHSLAVGGVHSCGLTGDGIAYCWGSNRHGELGDGRSSLQSAVPVRVAGDFTFSALDAGSAACGLTVSGRAYCWGPNGSGETGTDASERCVWGNTAFKCNPRPVPLSGGMEFRAINMGGSHNCGTTLEGVHYCWGNNAGGQLGHGEVEPRFSATPLRVYGD